MKQIVILITIIVAGLTSCCNLQAQEQEPYEIIPDTILARDCTGLIKKDKNGNFENIWSVANRTIDYRVEGYIEGTDTVFRKSKPSIIYQIDSNLNTVRYVDFSRFWEGIEMFDDAIAQIYTVIGKKMYFSRRHYVYPADTEMFFYPYMERYLFICNMNNSQYTLYSDVYMCDEKDLSCPYFLRQVNKDSTFTMYNGQGNFSVIDTAGVKRKQVKSNEITGNTHNGAAWEIYSDYGSWRVEFERDIPYPELQYDWEDTLHAMTFIPIDLENFKLNKSDSVRIETPYIWTNNNTVTTKLKQIDDTTMLFIHDTLKSWYNTNNQTTCDIVIDFLNLKTGNWDKRVIVPNIPFKTWDKGEMVIGDWAGGIDYENKDSIYMTFVGLDTIYDPLDNKLALYIVCFNEDKVHFVKKYTWEGMSVGATNLTIINGKFFMHVGSKLIKYAPNGGVIDTAPQDSSSLVDIATTEKLLIFPNPTRENLTILSESTIMQIDLINSKGQIVYTDKANSKNITFTTGKYPKGNYLLKVYTSTEIYTEKVIIE